MLLKCELNNKALEKITLEISTTIRNHKEYIIENYNGKDSQILIKNELKEKILELTNTLKSENFTQEEVLNIGEKELIKAGVKDALGLKMSDIILIKTNSIFIKLFAYPLRNSDRRFNGINEGELLSFYNEHCTVYRQTAFLKDIAKEFVEKFLLTRKVTNHEYETNALQYILTLTKERLIKDFDSNEDFFKGLAGYIFRKHFKELYGNIAELILLELITVNKYIMKFLNYYSLGVIILGGDKYKVPSLLNEKGGKWTLVSMLPLVKLYIKARDTSKELEVQKKEQMIEIKKLYIDGTSPLVYNSQLKDEDKRLSALLNDAVIKQEGTVAVYKDLKDRAQKKKIKLEYESLKNEIMQIREEKKILQKKLLDERLMDKYRLLQNKIDDNSRLILSHERTVKQNIIDFMALKDTLAQTLVSKKQKI